MKYKKKEGCSGNSVVTVPIILIVAILGIIYVGMYMVNAIVPFIWHQKLNTISQKYMFVIEKYGYLTTEEEELLISDLEEQGFKVEDIEIVAPKLKKDYGELITFCIKYELEQKMPAIIGGSFTYASNKYSIMVRKNSYSKI